MNSLDIAHLLFLFIAALLAGAIDAMVGGGGLIQVPALLITYPDKAIAMLFGTNKLAAAMGTGLAARRYLREVSLPVQVAGVAATCAFLGSFGGAMSVTFLNPSAMRPVVILLLCLVSGYTVCKPQLGREGSAASPVRYQVQKASLLGGIVGFYDGFFGPGTGTFFLFGFVLIFGFDFLTASGLAKVANLSTNVAALLYFLPTGNVLVVEAIVMAAGNMLGAVVGVTFAIKQGATFVRSLFLIVVTALTIRLAYVWFW